MKDFQKDFENRASDIDEYLRFLKFYDSIALQKKEKLVATNYYDVRMEFQPSRYSQQILRANSYVLMYNLVEDTMNSIIIAVLDTINDNKTPLVHIKENIKHLYVKHRLGKLVEANCIVNKTLELMNHIEKGTHIRVDNFDFSVSGNADYETIETIIRKIGCQRQYVKSKRILVKDVMEKVRRYRNLLSHGNDSFSNIGSNLVLSDIEKDYEEIKLYLKHVLNNLEKYLNNKKYLIATKITAP